VAAVRQAIENVARHADATRATVFVDAANDVLTITIRDDGKGFVYDEEELRSAGKLGLLQSMKGRIEALGGEMSVESSDRGTEIEFRVPL
jgi:signal transduction histidine kinase